MKTDQFETRRRHLKRLGIFLASLSLLTLDGCALFSSGKGSDSEKKSVEEAAFESQRESQDELAEFTASAGRKNPKEKKKVKSGETFLLSDKAKEIYARTER